MKLFILLSRVPFPLEKGDKLRAFHQIRHLSKHCEIHLCCLNDAGNIPGAMEALKPYCASINILPLKPRTIYWNALKAFFSGKPLQIGYFYNKANHLKINALIEEIQPDHIYAQLIRVAEYVKHLKIPKTLDYQDVFSTGYARQAVSAAFYLRPIFHRESRVLQKYESSIFDYFDHHAIISEPDRDEIKHDKKDQICIIHNGVDTSYFTACTVKKDIDILFTGNMNYPPNILGAEFLVHEILPVLRRFHPGVKVMIAGAHPAERVNRLASSDVEVTGWMDDIRVAYRRARIFIAPMTIGTGLQNKLLEAMAMKLPCITSPLANAALGAEAGKEIVVCEHTEAYVSAITQLLDDVQYAEKLAAGGMDFVKRNFSWEAETIKLLNLMQIQVS